VRGETLLIEQKTKLYKIRRAPSSGPVTSFSSASHIQRYFAVPSESPSSSSFSFSFPFPDGVATTIAP
jgi:hypothetical protein